MTRAEQLATKDKVALEKQRLFNRAGRAAREYRDNLPPEGVSLTEAHPGAAGFIADADRFHTDVVGEELVRRTAEHERRQQIVDHRRRQKQDREENRWTEMRERQARDEERWGALREEGVKAKKNASGIPYDMISLTYRKGADGARLRHDDALTQHRAALRSNQLSRLGDGRSGYNIISGAPCAPRADPPRPLSQAAPAAAAAAAAGAHWMAHA
ncbi:hypothetical protein JKP88DRAFT_269660 [Tribonema minus]|uniref:Uncharacterized protein n=1 Tax=Tribonema minus TaxID=303371 RepID=A0A835Z1N9_9STRA|nr:hypothetical protein JKP88DRAFT_269660 [Tribonema minus]